LTILQLYLVRHKSPAANITLSRIAESPRIKKRFKIKCKSPGHQRLGLLAIRCSAAFLAYYGIAAVPSPVRWPQDKGRVEASIKYVKNNFLKGLKSREYDTLVKELQRWNEEIASQRVHGTTRKVPRQVFDQIEKHV